MTAPGGNRGKARRKRLVSGGRPVMGCHSGHAGAIFRGHFKALAAELGPFVSDLDVDDASAIAAAWTEWRLATEELAAARVDRETGRGRRPSRQLIARLQKRAGISWATYERSRERFEARMAANRRSADPLKLLLDGGDA